MKIKELNYVFITVWIILTVIFMINVYQTNNHIGLYKKAYYKMEKIKFNAQDLLLLSHDITLQSNQNKLNLLNEINDIFSQNKKDLEVFFRKNIDKNFDLTLLSNDLEKLKNVIQNYNQAFQNQQKYNIDKEFLDIQASAVFTLESSIFKNIINLNRIMYENYSLVYDSLINKLYAYVFSYLFLSFVVFLTIQFKVTMPHTKLLNNIKEYADNRKKLIQPKGNDEISLFIKEFNNLFEKINKNDREISKIYINKIQQKAIYETILNTIDEDFILYDGDENIILSKVRDKNDFTKDTLNHIDILDLFKNQNISEINRWFKINNVENYLEINIYKLDDEKLEISNYIIVTIKNKTSTILLEQQSRQNEELLVQQSKMASMGEMIGSIAHQWRQPLAIVSGVLTNIEDAFIHNSLKKDYLDKQINVAEKNILFMSQTIDDFRNFFTPSKEKKKFSVTNSLINSLHIVNSQLQENLIEVSFNKKVLELPLGLQNNNFPDIVLGYENEFSQVIVNIITNSKDEFSIKNIKYPRLNIEVYSIEKEIIVDIEDNANGIDEKIIHKIFDPYFSTKKELNGTGIGLYMSKMIIEKSMEGSIEAMNTKNGALFRIKLKRVMND